MLRWTAGTRARAARTARENEVVARPTRTHPTPPPPTPPPPVTSPAAKHTGATTLQTTSMSKAEQLLRAMLGPVTETAKPARPATRHHDAKTQKRHHRRARHGTMASAQRAVSSCASSSSSSSCDSARDPRRYRFTFSQEAAQRPPTVLADHTASTPASSDDGSPQRAGLHAHRAAREVPVTAHRPTRPASPSTVSGVSSSTVDCLALRCAFMTATPPPSPSTHTHTTAHAAAAVETGVLDELFTEAPPVPTVRTAPFPWEHNAQPCPEARDGEAPPPQEEEDGMAAKPWMSSPTQAAAQDSDGGACEVDSLPRAPSRAVVGLWHSPPPHAPPGCLPTPTNRTRVFADDRARQMWPSPPPPPPPPPSAPEPVWWDLAEPARSSPWPLDAYAEAYTPDGASDMTTTHYQPHCAGLRDQALAQTVSDGGMADLLSPALPSGGRPRSHDLTMTHALPPMHADFQPSWTAPLSSGSTMPFTYNTPFFPPPVPSPSPVPVMDSAAPARRRVPAFVPLRGTGSSRGTRRYHEFQAMCYQRGRGTGRGAHTGYGP